jgi:aminotransferase
MQPIVAALAGRNRIWSRFPSGGQAEIAVSGDVIDLRQSYLTEPPPPHIAEAARAALDHGETHYVDHAGLKQLREAIASSLSQAGKPALAAEDILVTSGAQEGLFVALRALVQPGDQVLVPDPGYALIEPVVELAGGTIGRVPSADGFGYSVGNLEKCLGPKTRFVVLVSPNCATGRVIAPSEFENILQLADQHELTIILDGALEKGIYESRDAAGRPSPSDSPRLILIGSVSKFYRMGGWRIGWIAAQRGHLSPLKTFKQMLSICSASISQWAALAALTGPQDWLTDQMAELASRRDTAIDALVAMQLPVVPPDAALYLLFDVRRTGLASAQFADLALREAHIALVPGNDFGAAGEGYMRLSLAQPIGKLLEALHRLEKLVSRLD